MADNNNTLRWKLLTSIGIMTENQSLQLSKDGRIVISSKDVSFELSVGQLINILDNQKIEDIITYGRNVFTWGEPKQ